MIASSKFEGTLLYGQISNNKNVVNAIFFFEKNPRHLPSNILET